MDDGNIATDLLVPLGLAGIMASLGLTLVLADFRRVLSAPRGVAIGIVNLLVLSPLLAFAVAGIFGLAPALAVGLVLLGASPGGTMANLLTHLAKGETALSVTITAVSSLTCIITVPLYLALAVEVFDADLGTDVDVAGIALRVFLITLVPLGLGMALRARRPELVARIAQRVRSIALVLFVGIVAAAVGSEFDLLTENFAEVAAACLALNVAAMGMSFAIARRAGLSSPQATAITMELGVHNSTVAIAVGTSIATVLTIPAAVYSAFMFLTAGAFARLIVARNAAQPGSQRPGM